MRSIHRTSQFKKDAKCMKRRGKDLAEFKEVIEKLASDQVLETKYQDHPLIGQYKDTRECHIESDWLLVYERTKSELVLVRTGTHSDLFK
ncbi:MAG: type II toxin-antitoxin system YafQ family toxin [Chloroflexota bacterium]